MGKLIGEHYAAALFDITVENSLYEQINAELSALAELFRTIPDYTKLIASPAVSIEKKHKLISQLLNGKVNIYLFNFCHVLIDNSRFSYFCDVAEEYAKLVDEHNNVMRVEAVTAAPLTDELTDKLVAKLSSSYKKKIVLKNTVDNTVIGGVKLKFDQNEIDGTVKTQLSNMKKQLKEQSI